MPLDEYSFLEKVRKRTKLERKIESEVFDRTVLLTIVLMMDHKLISTIDFPISKGKEAYVFRTERGEKLKGGRTKRIDKTFAALKVYMIETSHFRHMQDYIRGDPRFRKVSHSKQRIVYEWTRKEFRNLKLCYGAGVHVPMPYYFKNNTLLMDYVGDENGNPAPSLKRASPPDPKKNFKQIISDMKKMYSIGLIHGDLSEYNVLVKDSKLYIIDVGQSVLLDHPMAEEFLVRDVKNLINYFSKYGVKADFDKVLKEIKGKE